MEPGEKSETSLRDDLAAGLKAIEERDAAPQDDNAPAPEAVAEVEPAEPKTDRGDGRDAHGKFVSKPKEDIREESQTPEGEQSSHLKPADAQAQQASTEAAPSATEDQPPKSWRADEAKVWASLDPVAKAAVIRREADAAKLAGHNDAERMFGREMADLYRPFMGELQQAGVSPQHATKILLDNHNILRSGKPEERVAKARQLMREYGIPAEALIDQDGPQDPHVRSLQSEIESLKSRLNTPVSSQQYTPLPPSAEEANIQSEIEAFRADPAHPHFEVVAPQMGKLLQAEAAPDLETAYRMAVAADPALRSTPTIQVAAANSQEKTAAARRASASVTGSPGPVPTPSSMSLREELTENARRLGFSV